MCLLVFPIVLSGAYIKLVWGINTFVNTVFYESGAFSAWAYSTGHTQASLSVRCWIAAP